MYVYKQSTEIKLAKEKMGEQDGACLEVFASQVLLVMAGEGD